MLKLTFGRKQRLTLLSLEDEDDEERRSGDGVMGTRSCLLAVEEYGNTRLLVLRCYLV